MELTLTLQILRSTNFVKQKKNSKNLKLSSKQCKFSLSDVCIVIRHEWWKTAVWKFLRRSFYTAIFWYSEISLRQNIRTVKFSTAKFPYGEISYGEISGHGHTRLLIWIKNKALKFFWIKRTFQSMRTHVTLLPQILGHFSHSFDFCTKLRRISTYVFVHSSWLNVSKFYVSINNLWSNVFVFTEIILVVDFVVMRCSCLAIFFLKLNLIRVINRLSAEPLHELTYMTDHTETSFFIFFGVQKNALL